MISFELKQRIANEVQRYIEIANNIYKPASPLMMPTISYKLRSKSNAGMAHTPKWRLRFNPLFLERNVEHFIARTVPHEVAHLVTDKLFYMKHGKYPRGHGMVHGAGWRSVMRTFGVPHHEITRCHSYNSEEIKQILGPSHDRRRNLFSCPSCGKETKFGDAVHKRIMQGFHYFTRCCKQRIKLPGSRTEPTPEVLQAYRAKRIARRRHMKEQRGGVPTKFETAYSTVAFAPSNMTRKQVIELIMKRCHMSFAGAQTYYYKAKGFIEKKS